MKRNSPTRRTQTAAEKPSRHRWSTLGDFGNFRQQCWKVGTPPSLKALGNNKWITSIYSGTLRLPENMTISLHYRVLLGNRKGWQWTVPMHARQTAMRPCHFGDRQAQKERNLAAVTHEARSHVVNVPKQHICLRELCGPCLVLGKSKASVPWEKWGKSGGRGTRFTWGLGISLTGIGKPRAFLRSWHAGTWRTYSCSKYTASGRTSSSLKRKRNTDERQ